MIVLDNYSDGDLKLIVNSRISFLSTGKKPVDFPVGYILGGQPGSGKTTLHHLIAERTDSNIISINTDDYREFHPNFEAIVKKYGRDFVAHTNDFAKKISYILIEYFSERNFNLIIEGTLRTAETPEKFATALKEKGYTVNLYVMAVPAVLSYIGTLERYENQYISRKEQARATGKDFHDHVVEQFPLNLQYLYEKQVFSEISIYTREGEEIYSSIATPSQTPVRLLKEILYQDIERENLLEIGNRVLKKMEKNNRSSSLEYKELKRKISPFSNSSLLEETLADYIFESRSIEEREEELVCLI